MTSFVFFLSAFACLTLTGAGILITLFKKSLRLENRIFVFLKDGNNRHVKKNQRTGKNGIYQNEFPLSHRVIQPSLHKLRHYTHQKMPGHTTKELEKRLQAAGYPFGWNPVDFRITQILLGVTFFLLIFLLFSLVSDQTGRVVIVALAMAGLGYYYPLHYINVKGRRRIHLIEKSMPDFFDMMNLSIEAGLGLDGAIAKVSRKIGGPLSEEFLRTLDDMKLGKSRRQAFTELRERIPSDQFQSVMTALIQADQLGIGMAKVLRSLTLRIREQRREKARESAMKAPIKMLFPMVFFIFPTIFIVLLGPLIIFLVTEGLPG